MSERERIAIETLLEREELAEKKARIQKKAGELAAQGFDLIPQPLVFSLHRIPPFS